MEKIEWSTQKRKLSELVPASYNPRKLSKKAYYDLKQSLEKFNLADLPSVNTNNVIISGHQRVRVLTDIYGRNHEIEVRVPNRLLDLAEERELNIRANKNLGQWDWDILGNEFEIEELKLYGFDEDEMGLLLTDEGTDFNLPSGEKGGLEQITFTLSADQATQIKEVLATMKETEDYKALPLEENSNSNGNALFIMALKCQQKI